MVSVKRKNKSGVCSQNALCPPGPRWPDHHASSTKSKFPQLEVCVLPECAKIRHRSAKAKNIAGKETTHSDLERSTTAWNHRRATRMDGRPRAVDNGYVLCKLRPNLVRVANTIELGGFNARRRPEDTS